MSFLQRRNSRSSIFFIDRFSGSTNQTRLTSHVANQPTTKVYTLAGNTGTTVYKITSASTYASTGAYFEVNENISTWGGGFTTVTHFQNFILSGTLKVGKKKTIVFFKGSSDYTSIHNDCYGVVFDVSSNKVELARSEDGGSTVLESTAVTMAAGDKLSFEIICRGSSFTVHATRSSNGFTHSLGHLSSVYINNRGIGFGGTSASGAQLFNWYASLTYPTSKSTI